MLPDFNVAIKFINEYTEFCKAKSPGIIDSTWIDRNPLLTKSFKTRYNFILDSAFTADPELGLDCDPIFWAQDFDDEGFVILKADSTFGYVTMVGKEWKEITVEMKVVYENNKWLVDGSGLINMPKGRKIK